MKIQKYKPFVETKILFKRKRMELMIILQGKAYKMRGDMFTWSSHKRQVKNSQKKTKGKNKKSGKIKLKKI